MNACAFSVKSIMDVNGCCDEIYSLKSTTSVTRSVFLIPHV